MTDVDPDRRVVTFSGALTVRWIQDAWTWLTAALAQDCRVVVIDAADAAEVDLSFVQLIEAARISAAQTGRELVLAAPAAGSLRSALERAGFLQPPDRRAFWLQEELNP